MTQHPDQQVLYQKLEENQLPKDFLVGQEKDAWQKTLEQAKRLEQLTLKKGCEIITPDSPDYPPLLREIYGKPAAIYVKGDLSFLHDQFAVSIVGTRRNSDYGRDATQFLTEGLVANGVAIVSGLAFGVDSIALETAADCGGKTIGVLACGLDYDYPKGNRVVKRKVADSGAVISEYPMGTVPRPYMFYPRNRLLAGISRGVIIVEAGENSGSLVTADWAIEHNRDVFVVPSQIFSGTFAGSHNLIRAGHAKLVASPQDILEEYNFSKINTVTTDKKMPTVKVKVTRKLLPEGLDESVHAVYNEIDESKQTTDEITYKSKQDISQVLASLTMLELIGLIKSLPGGYFTLA